MGGDPASGGLAPRVASGGLAPPVASGDLAPRVASGDLTALARALTAVENEPDTALGLLRGLRPRGDAARAHRVGVTGPPGAGKSTLVSSLIGTWRKAGRRVGVLAVDPSSPFSGGALLGDRVRMTEHLGDAGVFVRSLASRGAAGGLAACAEDAADLLEAAGFDPVVLETLGVGQGEIDVARAADTVVLVLAPGAGDDVQAMKAGLLEVADVVVVNQADRAGADRLQASLEAAFALRTGLPAPPVFATVATTGRGVEPLAAAIDARTAPGLARARAARRHERARRRVAAAVDRERARRFWAGRERALEAAAAAVVEGQAIAADAAARLLADEAEGR